MFRRNATVCGLAAAVVLAACGGGSDTNTNTNTNANSNGNNNNNNSSQAACTSPTPVECADQVIQSLNLQKAVAPGLITNTADGANGWTSLVDATAGGFGATKPDSYVYAKFTATGLTKVSLGDEDALDSMDWDIAFRRYIIRLNGADSGPSCVGSIRMPGTPPPAFTDVVAVPDGIPWRMDDDFTAAPTCSLIDDGSGLPDSPGTALSSYYSYSSCLAMNKNVYLVRVASGIIVKLQVTAYYKNGQAQCDSGGTAGSPSAWISLHWAYL
jgi:hypothetical protein